ncbi:DMT family transporter [Terriglobus tenax]|uniref:DMT family transporter n=1 Tax=Terriglobus tenax TaxID=1111115 RepID=UPI0021DF9E10|nr:DMT family transporter [Terriglobus tenax]
MSQDQNTSTPHDSRRLHWAGVVCGLCAGVWLGAAEAPTKLVNAGLSPFAVSLCMVSGVFAARWTLPTLLKGTSQVAGDLMRKKYLIIWALLAGMMWAVANTLTVFAIRDVGLTIAFPLWNTNSLIGLLWGRLLFGELKKASPANIARVVIGTVAIVAAATLLGFSTMHGGSSPSPHAVQGILAALGASLLWGTMYIPYRKAYISGMNPLSFVTAFTFGELGTVFALVWFLDGGAKAPIFHTVGLEHLLFWLFLGGFVWVIGDIFQQFATKYLGIGRGIPLSNTNQLWGLAWGALVFGELANASATQRIMVIAGSLIMIGGAIAISTAVATQREHNSMQDMLQRECDRYNLDIREVVRDYSRPEFDSSGKRSIGDYAIVATATAVFLYLGLKARVPQIAFSSQWVVVLVVVMLASVGAGIFALRKLSNS